MTDLQQMGGKVEPPETVGRGNGPHRHGPGGGPAGLCPGGGGLHPGPGAAVSCVPAGYFPCAEAEAVIEAMGYDPERDVENTADSVFCSHGAGVVIPWREVGPARPGGQRLAPTGDGA